MHPVIQGNDVPRAKNSHGVARDVFAALVWLYAIVKLFVLDFDVYLIQQYVRKLAWLVHFKFVLFLVFISIYWLTVGGKHLINTILFIALFPLYLIFWRLGKLAFRNWFTAFAVIGYVGSFLKSLKFNLATFALFCVAALLVVVPDHHAFIITGIILLMFYLVAHFGRRSYYAFVPYKALVFPREGIIRVLAEARKHYALPTEMKSTTIEKFTEEQRTTWATNLQMLLIANRASTFIARRLREFQKSRLVILYFIFGLVFTFFVTVVTFAIANLGLHRLNPMAFSDPAPRRFVFFLYYSINTIFKNAIPDFLPASAIARLLNTTEIFLGWFIVAILLFMYVNIKSDRTDTEMDLLVRSLSRKGKDLELFINREFSLDIERAISEVAKLPSNFIKIIYYFSSDRGAE